MLLLYHDPPKEEAVYDWIVSILIQSFTFLTAFSFRDVVKLSMTEMYPIAEENTPEKRTQRRRQLVFLLVSTLIFLSISVLLTYHVRS